MRLFGSTASEKMIDCLLNVHDNQRIIADLTTLQNEIDVEFDTKVVALASIRTDSLTAAFAKGFADAFSLNQSNCLIVDANLYNPSLANLLTENAIDITLDFKKEEGYSINKLSDRVFSVFLDKETYPSEVFKSGFIQRIITEQAKNFEHVVVITPSIKEHKEIALLKDVIQSVVLISQRNVTLKKNIYEACAFLIEEKLPLAKTIVLR